MNFSEILAYGEDLKARLLEVALWIQDDQDRLQSTNDKIVPDFIIQIQSALHVYGRELALSTEKIATLTSSDKEVNVSRSRTQIKRIGRDFRSAAECVKGIRKWIEGISAIMEVLESFNSLSDENKASFEDLERLAKDCEEDIARAKDMLQGIEL